MTGKVLQPSIRPADAAGIAAAAEVLRAGGLVAVPTETVYGLAARADSADAVASIYRAKGRPDFNPLIVHVPDLASAEAIAEFDDRARQLAREFWPGALTLVLPLRPEARITPAVTAGLPTIALRCPAHPAMRELLRQCGLPLSALETLSTESLTELLSPTPRLFASELIYLRATASPALWEEGRMLRLKSLRLLLTLAQEGPQQDKGA